MNVVDLHKILDDVNCKISVKQFRDILFELKCDVFFEITKYIDKNSDIYQWYLGESNAFQIALDLSTHIFI